MTRSEPRQTTIEDTEVLLTFFFIFVAALSLFLTFRYFNLARHLQAIPRASIRSAPQGYVEITGRARSLLPVPYHAPGTSVPCVWFECSYRQGQGDDSTLEYKRSESSFLLDDGTGICRIDPYAMTVETRASNSNLMQSIGLDSREPLVSSRWIGVDEVVHAYGRFDTLDADFHQQKQDMIRQRLGRLKRDRALMASFDTDGDGAIDIGEWEQAREAVTRDVEAYFDARQRQRDNAEEIHVLRPADDDSLPFLVSSHDELRNVRRYRLYAFAWLILFILAVSALFDPDFIDWANSQIEWSLRPPG